MSFVLDAYAARSCPLKTGNAFTASVVAFGASVYGLGFVQQQFFPASNRPELLVTMSLPKNASIAAMPVAASWTSWPADSTMRRCVRRV